MHKTLFKLAEKFKQEGKTDLANEINDLLSTGSRQKAPLKSLNEDVKKDLLKFVHRVKENIEDSMEALEEFFRRLRYFDIGDTVKDLRLDKALKELSKTHECMDNAGKSMYALTYGKYPSRSDMEQLAEDFGPKEENKGPLEFFESQQGKPNPTEAVEEGEEPTDEEYDAFMESLYAPENEEESEEAFEDEE